MDSEGSKLTLVTNLNAPNKRIVTVDASNPAPANWQDLIPETENVLSPSMGGGYIFARYMVDAVSKVKQFNKKGNLVRTVELPGVGTAYGFGAEKDDEVLYYAFSNYKTPTTSYMFDIKSGKS